MGNRVNPDAPDHVLRVLSLVYETVYSWPILD